MREGCFVSFTEFVCFAVMPCQRGKGDGNRLTHWASVRGFSATTAVVGFFLSTRWARSMPVALSMKKRATRTILQAAQSLKPRGGRWEGTTARISSMEWAWCGQAGGVVWISAVSLAGKKSRSCTADVVEKPLRGAEAGDGDDGLPLVVFTPRQEPLPARKETAACRPVQSVVAAWASCVAAWRGTWVL